MSGNRHPSPLGASAVALIIIIVVAFLFYAWWGVRLAAGAQEGAPTVTWIVDRIEETAAGDQLAVVELDLGHHLIVPLDQLPAGAREGARLLVTVAP